eukprot:1799216-Pyramimonas_sp.AAC.1
MDFHEIPTGFRRTPVDVLKDVINSQTIMIDVLRIPMGFRWNRMGFRRILFDFLRGLMVPNEFNGFPKQSDGFLLNDGCSEGSSRCLQTSYGFPWDSKGFLGIPMGFR